MTWTFGRAPFLIAGPCMVEGDELMLRVAEALAALAARHDLPVCFKASFDKANASPSSLTRRSAYGNSSSLGMTGSSARSASAPCPISRRPGERMRPASPVAYGGML